MSPQGAHFIVAAGVVIAIGCLFLCTLLPDPDDRQRKAELERKREEAKRRRQLEAEHARNDLIARGKHIHQIPLSQYKPPVAYLSPERVEPPKPANVSTLRRAKR